LNQIFINQKTSVIFTVLRCKGLLTVLLRCW